MKMTEMKTEHLRIVPSQREDLPVLEELYRLNDEYFYHPSDYDVAASAEAQMNGESLPPGGKPDDQTHFSVWSGENIIGYCCVDLYYPDEKSAFLPILFIAPGARRNGMGREIVQAIKVRLVEMGFERFGLDVGLRNWAGIAFWLRQGFDKISKIRYEGETDIAGRVGVIGLECNLVNKDMFKS